MSDIEIPKHIRDLKLTLGATTVRQVFHCPDCMPFHEDKDGCNIADQLKNIFILTTSSWNPIRCVEDLRQETRGEWHCNVCGDEGHCEESGLPISNRKAIAHMLTQLVQISLLREELEKKKGSSSRDAIVTVPCCQKCSSTDLHWNTYGYVEPMTDLLVEGQKMSSEATCSDCGHASVIHKEKEISAHFEMEVRMKRREIAQKARADHDAILEWLREHGEMFDVDEALVKYFERARDFVIPELLGLT